MESKLLNTDKTELKVSNGLININSYPIYEIYVHSYKRSHIFVAFEIFLFSTAPTQRTLVEHFGNITRFYILRIFSVKH